MNRYYAFRFWEKEFNKMTYLSLNQFNFVGVNFNDFEIMQYIGLKDKNGKEIYEGDILSFGIYENEDRRLVVKFEKLEIDDFVIYGYDGQFEYGEIIGNIYENPELIPKEDV